MREPCDLLLLLSLLSPPLPLPSSPYSSELSPSALLSLSFRSPTLCDSYSCSFLSSKHSPLPPRFLPLPSPPLPSLSSLSPCLSSPSSSLLQPHLVTPYHLSLSRKPLPLLSHPSTITHPHPPPLTPLSLLPHPYTPPFLPHPHPQPGNPCLSSPYPPPPVNLVWGPIVMILLP